MNYFDDGTHSGGVKNIFPLNDGTVLLSTWIHLLRIRLADGLPGRTLQGFVAVDGNEMLAFKQGFKKDWEKRHIEAEKLFSACLKRYRVIRGDKDNFMELLNGSCKKEYGAPDYDDFWHIQLNAEIEHRYLNR
jgi:hypothetical protein